MAPSSAVTLAAVCLLFGCTTSGTTRTASVDFEDGNGFTITEPVRVSSGVRSDFERALRLIEEQQYEGGIELLRKVTEAAPDATAAHLNLGIAHEMAGDYEKAEASIAEALKLNPRHPAALNEIGIVYRKTGRFGKARESYEEALSIYPDFHFARRNLAILCDVYLRDLSCAVEHYELYTKVMPDDEAVVMWLADLQNRMGK